MCGIAGYFAPQSPQRVEMAVRQMMTAMSRRGPDSEGFEAWPNGAFGHRRLAILDLSSAGHQPMLSEDRSIGVVFNGCIYNFAELRMELERDGFSFRSSCDTEVLVHGYKRWGGEELCRRLRGMYAFAVWDEVERTLSLARDRLGVKPLVYRAQGREIAFASTPSALAAAGLGGSIGPDAVLQYLDYGNVAGDACIFEGVRKLPPGSILRWKDGDCKEQTYWTLPEASERSSIRFEEAVEETERLLVEATKLRLISDVPLSALLSGGIDSTLVCWALARLNVDITAFTVGAAGDESDETQAAVRTARKLGIRHQVVQLPEERPEMLTELESAYSEPFSSQSAQAMLRVSRAVRPIATVMLTGDGGDDVFLGYPFLYNAWLGQQTARKIPAFAAPLLRGAGNVLPGIGPVRQVRSLLRYATNGLSSYVAAGDRASFRNRHRILGDRLIGASEPVYEQDFGSARHLLRDVLRYQNRMHFLGEFLPKVDGATMYHSVEARSPLLDQKLWEFAAALPPSLRFHGGQLKAILRAIVRKHLGSELADRPKQGFTVPVERWLADKWTASLDVLTGPNELERQGWIRPGSLRTPIQEARGKGWVPIPLWRLLLLEHWLRKQSAS